MKIIFLILAILIFIPACQQTNNTPPNPYAAHTMGDDPVKMVFDEGAAQFVEVNYREVTEEALEHLRNLHIFDEDTERWFIRYYIENFEEDKGLTVQEMAALARDRAEFETAWREYASTEYGVEVTEEEIDAQIDYNVEAYGNTLPPAVQGISNGLNISYEEYMREFDRDYAERTVIWQKLMPVLLDKHYEEESERLDGVFLGQAYEEEVEAYLEGNP
ncbi:hypothetical protein MM300_03350 [Evansella sp. LMS18]|uniref:hypothetical protein n=1 Tax=Evansella sp. LMS18 TaxID=2924033 RepID=UPI0020D1331D|nr:hypothetical protein [Evansella sp. LMS18]UTR11380.1 hypothetical protein MM300_03350 [Evansella sp. LMS18]